MTVATKRTAAYMWRLLVLSVEPKDERNPKTTPPPPPPGSTEQKGPYGYPRDCADLWEQFSHSLNCSKGDQTIRVVEGMSQVETPRNDKKFKVYCDFEYLDSVWLVCTVILYSAAANLEKGLI